MKISDQISTSADYRSIPSLALSPLTTGPYRPDIDGLRALAVMSVVLYHAFPKWITGGYVGVDIFFVISGFLISSILFRETAENRFSISAFYGRRIRRIFPALALCLTAVLTYGFISLVPSELTQLGKHAFFGAAFLSNFALWSESGYFDTLANLKPLLHLWSLGVEEQFYILWPPLIWLASRLKTKMVPLLAVLFLASFIINIALSVTNIADDFYLPVSRFWELIAGAGLACRRGSIERPLTRTWVSLVGMIALLASMALFSPEMRFPGWPALLPVIGAAMLIVAGPHALVNRVILSHRTAVFVGVISYPLYIWHWPLLSYAYIVRLGKAPAPLAATGLVAASILLAWATYRFVERPVRFGSHRRSRTVIAAGCVTVLGACGLATWNSGGFPERFPPIPGIDVQKISAASVDPTFKPTSGMDDEDHNKTLITHLGSGTRKVALSGDSLLFHYGPRVQELANQERLAANVYFVVGASCAPVPGIIQRDQFTHCANLPDLLIDLVTREKVQTVVLGASWPGYSGKTTTIDRGEQRLSLGTSEGQDAFYANLEDFVHDLQNRGAQVYLVLGVPTHPRFNPHEMVSRSLKGIHIEPGVQAPVPVSILRDNKKTTDSRLRDIAARTGAALLDPVPDICGDGEGCSPFFGAGEPKYIDGMHLRPIFVREHLHFLDGLLTKAPAS